MALIYLLLGILSSALVSICRRLSAKKIRRNVEQDMAEAGVPETAAGTSAEEKDDSPKIGDPGVCPDCGATDQTGKFCEYCGAKVN